MGKKEKSLEYHKKMKESKIRFPMMQERAQLKYKDFIEHRRVVNCINNGKYVIRNFNQIVEFSFNYSMLKSVDIVRINRTKFWVQNESIANMVLETLLKQSIIFLDAEFSQNSKLQHICIISISIGSTDFVFDVAPLIKWILTNFPLLLENKNILKVLYGSDNDLMLFKRDFNISIHPMVDLQELVKVLVKYEDLCFWSLETCYYNLFNVKISKEFTIVEWSIRDIFNRLYPDLFEYVRLDAFYLMEIWNKICIEHGRVGDLDTVTTPIRLQTTVARQLNYFKMTNLTTYSIIKNRALDHLSTTEIETFERLYSYLEEVSNYEDVTILSLMPLSRMICCCQVSFDNVKILIRNACKINPLLISRENELVKLFDVTLLKQDKRVKIDLQTYRDRNKKIDSSSSSGTSSSSSSSSSSNESPSDSESSSSESDWEIPKKIIKRNTEKTRDMLNTEIVNDQDVCTTVERVEPVKILDLRPKFCYYCKSSEHLAKNCPDPAQRKALINSNPVLRKNFTYKKRNGYRVRMKQRGIKRQRKSRRSSQKSKLSS